MVVNHSGKIMNIADVQAGTRNDKTVVLYDGFVHRLRNEDLFTKYQYTLAGEEWTGAWLLCDGGYHKWPETICGFKQGNNTAETVWSKRGESTRKVRICYSPFMGGTSPLSYR